MRISDWSSDVCSSDLWADIAIDHFPEIAPGGSATRAYCIDDALRQAFFRKPFYDLYTVTHFSAPPSRSRGPVGHYRLVVDKGAVTNLVAICPLTAKNTSPTTFEWTATNFTPGDELGVMFFEAPDTPSANAQEPTIKNGRATGRERGYK